MKYNDNGVVKDIIIKSGDTLPIGTIVEYDGTTIPSGYEEVSSPIVQTLNGKEEDKVPSVKTIVDELKDYDKFKNSFVDAGTRDMNNYTTTGIYGQDTNVTWLNGPTDRENNYSFLLVLSLVKNNNLVQIYFNYSRIFYRVKVWGSWSSWKRVTLT